MQHSPSTDNDVLQCTAATRTQCSPQGSDQLQHRSKHQQPALPSRAPSQRQACKGTFKHILQQQRQEDQVFAEFEAAVKLGMVTAAPTPPPAAHIVSEGGVVKKRRGRPPKPRPLIPVLTRPLFHGGPHIKAVVIVILARALLVCAANMVFAHSGPHLVSVLREVHSTRSSSWPLGTPVWVKVMGYCAWPGLVWSLDLCARATWPDIITSYVPGKLLVRYYGEHSSSWVAPKQLLLWGASNEAEKVEALKAWGKKTNRAKLVAATVAELDGRDDSREEELDRMTRMGKTYQLDHLQIAARARHSALLHPRGASGSSSNHTSEAAEDTAAAAGNGPTDGICSSSGACSISKACVPIHATEVVQGNPWGVCDVCREEVPNMRCSSCRRWLHALCCSPAALSPADFPPDKEWKCPACGTANKVKMLCEEEYLHQAAGACSAAERMGLTPDWIITTAAFKVFKLPRPTPECPYIAGLLDPACNNKLDPNIPAEVLFDKRDDGLKPSNSWAGYHIILNPDFRAQVQWKFVNRAIDEVENGNVPAVLLICRNSTDTAYFQRLRPYPRVLLRRSSAQFKDYEKSPIGFGVVVFCVAKSVCRELYERFFEGFAMFGEPNIPIDKAFMSSGPFYQLLDRLRRHAEQHARDHWVQCSCCGVWRIITYQQLHVLQGDAADWTCSKLRPPHTSCATPQSKAELAGMHHAAVIAAASGNIVAANVLDDAQQSLALAAALGEHQEQQPRSSKLLPALQQALLQQAALAAAAANGGHHRPAADTAAADAFPTKGGQSPAAMAVGTADPDVADAATNAAQTEGSTQPAVCAQNVASASSMATASSGATDLVVLLGAAADGVKLDLGVSYLCKSVAGQVTVTEAQQLLEAGIGKQPGAVGKQPRQSEQAMDSEAVPQADALLGVGGSSITLSAADDPATGAAAIGDCGSDPEAADHTAAEAEKGQPGVDQPLPKVPKIKRRQQQQQQRSPAKRQRQSSRLQLKRGMSSIADDKQQQQLLLQQQDDEVSAESDTSLSSGSECRRHEHAAAGNNRSRHKRQRRQQQQPNSKSLQQPYLQYNPIKEPALNKLTHFSEGAVEPPIAVAAAAAAAAVPEPALRTDKATQTPVPSADHLPGLRQLAVVVQRLLDDWLLLLVSEQLSAWDERQQLIQAALLQEQTEVTEQQQQELPNADQQDEQVQVQWVEHHMPDVAAGCDLEEQHALNQQHVTGEVGTAEGQHAPNHQHDQQAPADAGCHCSEAVVVQQVAMPAKGASLEQQQGEEQQLQQVCTADGLTSSEGVACEFTDSPGAAAVVVDAATSSGASDPPQWCDEHLADKAAAATLAAVHAAVAATAAVPATPTDVQVAAEPHNCGCVCGNQVQGQQGQDAVVYPQVTQLHTAAAGDGDDRPPSDSSSEQSAAAEAVAGRSNSPQACCTSACESDQPRARNSGAVAVGKLPRGNDGNSGLPSGMPAAVQVSAAPPPAVTNGAPTALVAAAAASVGDVVTVTAAAARHEAEVLPASDAETNSIVGGIGANGSGSAVAAAAVDSGRNTSTTAAVSAAIDTPPRSPASAAIPVALATDTSQPPHGRQQQQQQQMQLSHVALTGAQQAQLSQKLLALPQQQLRQQTCLPWRLFQPTTVLQGQQQQQQQYIMVRTAAPSIGAVTAGGLLQVQILPVADGGVQAATPQHVLQQQQHWQFQLQWQLAQATMLQQLRQQQLLVNSGMALTSVSQGARTAAPKQLAIAVAYKKRPSSTCMMERFDAEEMKRAAAKHSRVSVAAVVAEPNDPAAHSEEAVGMQCLTAGAKGDGSVGDAAFLAAQPRPEAAAAGSPRKAAAAGMQGEATDVAAQTAEPAAGAAGGEGVVETAAMHTTDALTTAAAAADEEYRRAGDHVGAHPSEDCTHTAQPGMADDAAEHTAADIMAAKPPEVTADAAAPELPPVTAHTADGSTDIAPTPIPAADYDDIAPPEDAAAKPPPVKPSLLLQVAPVCLSQGTILSLTHDPLLRAVLLEQPGMMRAVVGLMQQVCLFKQKQMQQKGAKQQLQRPAAAALEDEQCAEPDDFDAEQIDIVTSKAPVQQQQQGVVEVDAELPMFDLRCPGSDLICWDTLERLTHQPSSSSWGRKRHHNHHPTHQQHHDGEDDEDRDVPAVDVGTAGAGGGGGGGSDDDAAEFMSSLALAREARVAANRAYLRGVGLGPSAIQSGLVTPLEPDHMAMVTAARQIAKQAAVRRAEQQLSQRQRVLDARRRARRAHEAQLRAALDALAADEVQAQQLVRVAQQTLEDVKRFAG